MKRKIIIILISFCFLLSSKTVFANEYIENNFRKIKIKESKIKSVKYMSDKDQEETLEEAEDEYNIKGFLSAAKEYTEDIKIDDVYKSSITGDFNNKKFLNVIFSLFSKTFKETIKNFSSIIVIILISTILKSIADNLGNESVSKIAYFAEFALILTILLKNFSEIIIEMKKSLENLLSFSNTLIPLLSTLLIASGHISASSILEPLLILLVTFACNFIKNAVIPLILISTAVGIISNISDEVQLHRFSKFLKKGAIWVLTCILSLIISIASLESNLSANVNGVTKKASKTIISSAIPVVGNILANAIETITGYGNIIKNATGVIGIIVVLAICIKPISKLATYTIFYSLVSSLIEPITDKKIVGTFDVIIGSFKVFLGIKNDKVFKQLCKWIDICNYTCWSNGIDFAKQ